MNDVFAEMMKSQPDSCGKLNLGSFVSGLLLSCHTYPAGAKDSFLPVIVCSRAGNAPDPAQADNKKRLNRMRPVWKPIRVMIERSKEKLLQCLFLASEQAADMRRCVNPCGCSMARQPKGMIGNCDTLAPRVIVSQAETVQLGLKGSAVLFLQRVLTTGVIGPQPPRL